MMQVFTRHLLLLLSATTCAASLPAFSTEAEPIYYSDCAYIEFENIDNSQMTREEQLAAMDADFEKSLDASEECMSDALNSGAQKLAEAGANSGQQDSESADNSANSQASSANEYQTTQSQQEHSTSDQSRAHSGGQGQQGSSAVCDAVKQGLESATTENEKAHFKSLMNEYGCS